MDVFFCQNQHDLCKFTGLRLSMDQPLEVYTRDHRWLFEVTPSFIYEMYEHS